MEALSVETQEGQCQGGWLIQVNSVSTCQFYKAPLTSPVDECNCISWAEITEELPSKHKQPAINLPRATRSTLKGKSITNGIEMFGFSCSWLDWTLTWNKIHVTSLSPRVTKKANKTFFLYKRHSWTALLLCFLTEEYLSKRRVQLGESETLYQPHMTLR